MPVASRVAAEVLRVLPRKRISSAMGRLADRTGPAPLVQRSIQAFVQAYDVRMDEAEVPEGGFSSFDAFFTRALKPGSRDIDQRAEVVVAPSDGRVEDLGVIGDRAEFFVKGSRYEVGELLGCAADAEHYRGGTFFIVYLAPRDYHRVHAAVDGRVQSVRHVEGTLYPVNRIGLTHVPRLFARNERVVVHQASRFGAVATILVGAIGVGRISVSFDERVLTNCGRAAGSFEYGGRGPALRRGDEVGQFHLGSTAIVLLDPSHRYAFEIQRGGRVKMGQGVCIRERASS